jgi:hypothetical protein
VNACWGIEDTLAATFPWCAEWAGARRQLR